MPKVSEAYTNARREEIIDVAQHLFATNGFRDTQMRDIAERAGISTGAIYRYFASKDELVRTIIPRLHAHEDAHRRRVLGEGSAMDRLNRLPAEFVRLAESNEQNRCNFRDYGEATAIPLLAEALGEAFDHVAADVGALIQEAQKDGDVRRDLDVPMTAAAIASLIISVRFTRLFGGTFDGPEMQRTLEAMIGGLRT